MNYTHRRLITQNNLLKSNSARNLNKYVLCSQKIGSKNGNMVLQLVLPTGSDNSNHLENNNYLTKRSLDEILGNESTNKRRTCTSNFECQEQEYSTIRINNRDGYINSAFNNDLSDYAQGYSTESTITRAPSQYYGNFETSEHKASSPEEKNIMFRDYLTRILSCVYALFVVTLGLVVYVSDVIVGNSPIAETFSLYLVIIALIFILYLIIDICLYMKKRNMYNVSITNDIELKTTYDRSLTLNIQIPEDNEYEKPLVHHYCLNKDRHNNNFYLKVGAAGFCLGHLTHSGLLLGYQIVFLTSDGDAFYECGTVATLILDFSYPIYSFLLLYFIFKYSNIVINRNVALTRFGLMHCISSSLCFWVWTIFRETIESLSNHSYDHEQEENNSKVDTSDNNIPEVSFYVGEAPAVALPLTSYNKKGAHLLTSYLNDSIRHFTQICESDKGLGLIYQNYSPYLYPFSVEYSILVVGVLFIIWQNIGSCRDREEISSVRRCDSPRTTPGNHDNLESNIVIHADCHSANKGLFGGIVIIVITAVSIILFFIAINDVQLVELGILVNTATSIVIVLLMTITGILAYRQITKLDVNKGHISLLDDLLLFICIPAFFLNGIFSIIPAILSGSALSIAFVLLEVTQVLVQTPLIIDGLRRSSNTRELRREKPGRELLTFLIVCNVAMWITQTFEVKSHGLQDHRYEFYGKVLWTIIGHMCVPLMMFYRFHSSVCIVDIWKYAYEPSSH